MALGLHGGEPPAARRQWRRGPGGTERPDRDRGPGDRDHPPVDGRDRPGVLRSAAGTAGDRGPGPRIRRPGRPGWWDRERQARPGWNGHAADRSARVGVWLDVVEEATTAVAAAGRHGHGD